MLSPSEKGVKKKFLWLCRNKKIKMFQEFFEILWVGKFVHQKIFQRKNKILPMTHAIKSNRKYFSPWFAFKMIFSFCYIFQMTCFFSTSLKLEWFDVFQNFITFASCDTLMLLGSTEFKSIKALKKLILEFDLKLNQIIRTSLICSNILLFILEW